MHKRALRVLLGDYESTFECLLAKNNEIAIHTENLLKLGLPRVACGAAQARRRTLLSLWLRKERATLFSPAL